MDEIERSKAALQLPASGQDFVLERACKAFVFADKADRRGERTKGTAAAFRSAALVFEALRQFGEVPEECTTRMKYSVWRASHIMTKLAAGETPDPPPSSEEEEELDRLSQQDPDGGGGGGGAGGDGIEASKLQPPPNPYVLTQTPAFPSPPGVSAQISGAPAASSLPPVQPQNVHGSGIASAQFPAFPSPPTNSTPSPGINAAQFPAFPSPPANSSSSSAASGLTSAQFPAFPAPPANSTSVFPSVPSQPANPYSVLPQLQHQQAHQQVHQSQNTVAASLFPDVPSSSLMQFPSVPAPTHAPAQFPGVPGPAHAPAAHAHVPAAAPAHDFFDLPSVPISKAGETKKVAPPPTGQASAPAKPAAPAAKPSVVRPPPPPAEEDEEEEVVRRPAAPKIRFGAQPACYIPTTGDVAAAQRLSKTAFSALNFDDTTTAVRDLCEALKCLTGMEIDVEKKL